MVAMIGALSAPAICITAASCIAMFHAWPFFSMDVQRSFDITARQLGKTRSCSTDIFPFAFSCAAIWRLRLLCTENAFTNDL
jgi:hypothetical protein